MTICFELPSILTIYSVAETRDALLSWLARQDLKSEKFIEISAKSVEEIDGAGLQLIGSLARTLVDAGLPWEVSGAGQPIVEALIRVDLDKFLNNAQAEVSP